MTDYTNTRYRPPYSVPRSAITRDHDLEQVAEYNGVAVYANRYGGYEAEIAGRRVRYKTIESVRRAIKRNDEAIKAHKIETRIRRIRPPETVSVSSVNSRTGEAHGRYGNKIVGIAKYGVTRLYHHDPHTIEILCDILKQIDVLALEYEQEIANLVPVTKDNLADGEKWTEGASDDER